MKYFIYYFGDILPFLFVTALIVILIRYLKCKKTGVFNLKKELLYLFFYLYFFAVILKTVVPEQFLKFDFSTNPFTPLSEAIIWNNPVDSNYFIRAYVRKHDYIHLFDGYVINLFLLFPFGLIFPVLYPKRKSMTIPLAFIISASIELIQLFLPRITDTYDIFLNTLGAIFGFLIFMLYEKRRKA